VTTENSSGKAPSDRVDIIQAVKTPLGFYSLVVLVIEGIFGIVANSSQGTDRTYIITGMLLLIFLLVIIVASFAFFRPGALLGLPRDEDSLAGSLGSAFETFDRLSDEIEATIKNQPPPQVTRPKKFLIQRAGKDAIVYQRMHTISPDQFNQFPVDVQRQIRTYKKSMETLNKEWESIKRQHATSQIDPHVRDKQLALIRQMKSDLIGIVDAVERTGYYLEDHYRDVRNLILQL
jgi:hypothetical protein